MYQAFISYLKGLLGLHSKERNYIYFNPEGDFQDIRGLMPIEDTTMIPFIILIIFIFCLLIWGVYKMIKYINYKKSIQPKTLAKKHLLALNIKDAKSCAYIFSIWAPYLIEEKNMALYEKIEKDLFKYKYKKNTEILTDKEQKELYTFLEINHG